MHIRKRKTSRVMARPAAPQKKVYFKKGIYFTISVYKWKCSIFIINDNKKLTDYHVRRNHCSLEHNLPDSPFASPKAAGDATTPFSESPENSNTISSNNNMITGPSLFPTSSSLDIAPFKSCYFQVPRYHVHSHFCLCLNYRCLLLVKSINYNSCGVDLGLPPVTRPSECSTRSPVGLPNHRLMKGKLVNSLSILS